MLLFFANLSLRGRGGTERENYKMILTNKGKRQNNDYLTKERERVCEKGAEMEGEEKTEWKAWG